MVHSNYAETGGAAASLALPRPSPVMYLKFSLILSDNGCGVREDIAPFLFQEFFSMKSNGRGLGLYIVRELLSRIGAEILLIENEEDKKLPGANFLIKFNNEGKE